MRGVTVFVLVGIFVVAVAAASVFYTAHLGDVQAEAAINSFKRDLISSLERSLERQNEAVDRVADAFERIEDLKTGQELGLRRYRNADHLSQARARGVRVSGIDEAERLRDEGRLVRLADTRYYYLQDFDYSVPYVTPDASRLLEIIGERLQEELADQGLPAYRFNISSVLRTAENQRALRRNNPNATAGVSTHEFGTTIDIVYHIYDYYPQPHEVLEGTERPEIDEQLELMRRRQYAAAGMRYWRRLRGILGRILIDLQSEGKVLVTLERQQPVFHVTVAENLAE